MTFSIPLGVTLMVASRNGAHKSPPWSLTESLASESVVIRSNTCMRGGLSVTELRIYGNSFLVAAAQLEDVGSGSWINGELINNRRV